MKYGTESLITKIIDMLVQVSSLQERLQAADASASSQEIVDQMTEQLEQQKASTEQAQQVCVNPELSSVCVHCAYSTCAALFYLKWTHMQT